MRPQELDADDGLVAVLQSHSQGGVRHRQPLRLLRTSERQFREYVERSHDGVLVVDVEGRIEYANPGASRIYGYTPDELTTLRIADLIADDPRSQAEGIAHFRRVVEHGESLGEVLGRRKDGSTVVTDVSAVSVGDGRFLGTIRDTTERRSLQDHLRLTAAVFESTSEGILITDADGKIIRVNRSFTQMTGYSAEDAVGQTPRLLHSGRHDEAFYAEMWRSLAEEGRWEGEIWNRNKSGRVFPELLTINAIVGPDGEPSHYVAVFADITARKQTEERLLHLAHHDPLTGLGNRTLLHERMQQALVRAAREQTCFGVLFIDLDDFKTINDTLGHDAGDELLVLVAVRIGRLLHETDTLVRHGGDEFVILAEGCRGHGAAGAGARRILRALSEPFVLSAREVYVSASIGVAIFPDDGRTSADLLKNADAAMYRAKSEGRNRHRFFTEEMNQSVRTRLDLEVGLRHALDRGEFRMEFQPIFAPGERRPHHAEALIRWNRPGKGLVSPGHFMDLAEEVGVIVEIDRWVLRESCRTLADWVATDVDLRMAVNLSPRQFRDPGLPGQLRAVLDELRLSGDRLELEITERALLEHDDDVRRVMTGLHDLGVRVVIDDFGTGYSALSYLHRFHIDGLKIDRSFVSELSRKESSAALVRTIAAMARTLGIEITAEGVETPAQLQFLTDLGCDWLQGYLLGRPMSSSQISTWTLHSHGVPHA